MYDPRILKELSLNRPPKDIAEDLDVSYSKVLNHKKEFEQAKLNGTIHQLMDIDRTVLEHAAKDLDVPAEVSNKLAKGLDGLQNLDDALQATAMQINTKVKSMVMSAEQPSEIQVYAEIIANLRSAFFGKNQVAVQINNGQPGQSEAPAYRQFLGDAPGA